jgi:hypothetical protein
MPFSGAPSALIKNMEVGMPRSGRDLISQASQQLLLFERQTPCLHYFFYTTNFTTFQADFNTMGVSR